MRAHEKTTVTQAEGMLQRLEEEITLMKKKHTDLDKLSLTDDHIHFLQVNLCSRKPLENTTCFPFKLFERVEKRSINAFLPFTVRPL